MEISISTLGDLKQRGMGLYAHCSAPNAGHGSPLDLDALIERFGADHVYVNDTTIGPLCVCKKCGHKGANVTVTPNAPPAPGNSYAKAKGG